MPDHIYREYMKSCMLKKNVKGKSADEVRRALTECAEAWTRALARRVPEVFEEEELAEQFLKRYP